MKSPSRCHMWLGLSFQKQGNAPIHAECSAGVTQNSLPDSFAWSHAARISVSPIIAAAIVLTLVTPTQQRLSAAPARHLEEDTCPRAVDEM